MASPELDALEDQREELVIALSRYRKMQSRLDRYLEARTEHYGGAEHAIPDDVLPVMESYSSASEKYEAKVLELTRAVRVLDKARAAAREEQASMQKATDVDHSRPLQATISLYAEEKMDVELDLKYGTSCPPFS